MNQYVIKFDLVFTRPVGCEMPARYADNCVLMYGADEQDAIARLDRYVDQEVLCLTTMIGVPVLMDVGPGLRTPVIISIQEFVNPGQLIP